MEDHYGRKPSHASVLNWARALGLVGWTMPPRGRGPIAVDETVKKVNGREVYAWTAIDINIRELPSIKATWSRSSMDALLFLGRVLEACTNKLVFVVGGLPGAGPRVLPRDVRGHEGWELRVFFKDINVGRSRIAPLDMLMNIFPRIETGPGSRRG